MRELEAEVDNSSDFNGEMSLTMTGARAGANKTFLYSTL